MKYRQIGMGTKIELELYDENGEKTPLILVSQFESYHKDDNLMKIHAPFTQGKIYPVHPKSLVNINFSNDNETFMFRAEVINRINIEPIPMLWVKPVSPIEKIERRTFFRMECHLNIKYRIVDSFSADDNVETTYIEGYTCDISGGGVCLAAETELEKGTKIDAYLYIKKLIRFFGVVVRSIKVRERGKLIYETGVEFERIENVDRESIISYVFEVQRERLNKGWMKT